MLSNEIECNLVDIPEYNYNNWSIDRSTFQSSDLQFKHFFHDFMLKNLPCIIKNVASNWECATKWVKNNQINYEYLVQTYGELDAPVADCKNIEYNSQCKSDMKIYQYMEYMTNTRAGDKVLYLKDWHLRRIRPNDTFYEIPVYFALDWLNEFAIDNQEDDFMFVYIGPNGSWTPLHEDVYCSYSWSVNVVGRKKWLMFPPGEENKLKDQLGNLPLMFEPENHKNIKYFEIIQEKGDAIFVPSGWHHQVVNELDTISINHNWINACNIGIVWQALQNTLSMVEHQIEEFKDTSEYASECQLILKSLFGMDFLSFANLLCYIGKKRLSQLDGKPKDSFSKYCVSIDTIKFDLRQILNVMNSVSAHALFIDVLSSIKDEFVEVSRDIYNIFQTHK